MDQHQQHLSVDDLANRMGVPVDTIYLWNSKGVGPAYMRVGRHVRYRLRDVERWEQSRLVTTGDGRAPR